MCGGTTHCEELVLKDMEQPIDEERLCSLIRAGRFFCSAGDLIVRLLV